MGYQYLLNGFCGDSCSLLSYKGFMEIARFIETNRGTERLQLQQNGMLHN